MTLQNVKANSSIRVDIWMVDFCGEGNFGRLERVVLGKLDGEEENASLEWTVGRACTFSTLSMALFTHNCRLPVEQIIARRSCWALWAMREEKRETHTHPKKKPKKKKHPPLDVPGMFSKYQTCEGGSRSKSFSSLWIRFRAIFSTMRVLKAKQGLKVCLFKARRMSQLFSASSEKMENETDGESNYALICLWPWCTVYYI